MGWYDDSGNFSKIRAFSVSGKADPDNFVFLHLRGALQRDLVTKGEWDWYLCQKHKEISLTPQDLCLLQEAAKKSFWLM